MNPLLSSTGYWSESFTFFGAWYKILNLFGSPMNFSDPWLASFTLCSIKVYIPSPNSLFSKHHFTASALAWSQGIS